MLNEFSFLLYGNKVTGNTKKFCQFIAFEGFPFMYM